MLGARTAPLLEEEFLGSAYVETYTVFYGRDGEPRGGVVVGRTGQGNRTLARVDSGDADLIAWLTDGVVNPVGQFGTISGEDRQWRMA